MTNENDGPSNQGDAAIGTSAVSEAKPPNFVPSKPATEGDLDKVEQRLSGFERSTLGWTRASFGVVLATAVFICLQWLEIRSGGKDTHDLAVAADTQAKKMGSMSDAADKIGQAAEGIVTQEQRIADNAQQTFEANNRQSRENIEMLRAAQRAWVSVAPETFGTPGGIPAVGAAFMIRITFANTGKTPAKNVLVCTEIYLLDAGQSPADFNCDPAGRRPSAVVPPNGTIYSDGLLTPKLTSADQDKLVHGQQVAWIYGFVTYVDVFGKTHRTDFCNRLLGGGGYTTCDKHNNMD